MGKLNYFKKKWIKDMTDSLSLLNPNMDKKSIMSFVEKEFDSNVKNSECSLANNYIRKEFKTNLLDLIDWMYENKPIVAGYGTFYLDHHKAKNPNGIMLDGFGKRRSEEKNKLKLLDYTSYDYAQVDRAQALLKRNSNSFYGGSLAAKSPFYNEFVGESITASGQSLISTAQGFFESFISGNFKFIDFDDLANYIIKLSRRGKIKYKIEDVNINQVHDWLAPKLQKGRNHLYQALLGLEQDLLNRLYYTNNLMEALYQDYAFNLLIDIYCKVDDFRVAEKVPKEIEEHLDRLWNYLEDVVFFDGFFFDRIYRFKEDMREAAVLSDTDSVISTIAEWVEFAAQEIVPKAFKIDDDNTTFISVSIAANILTRGIKKTLLNYTRAVNIPDEYSHRLNMKNEFYMSRLALASTKKRYISLIKLREGDELIPAKFDAKGVDFLKGTTRKATKDFMFELCRNDILESKEIDVKDIRRKLSEFGDSIRQSLMRGEKEFLIPANVKEIEAYTKKPFSNQNVLAVLTWNKFNPENQIELPDFIDKVNITLNDKDSIERLKLKYPDKYKILEETFLIERKDNPLSGKDCKIIAIPQSIPIIPDWIIEFIDYDKLINDNLNRFNSVNESLGLVVDKLNSKTTMAFNYLSI